MKKIRLLSLLLAAALAGCGNKNDAGKIAEDGIYDGPTTEEELRAALANQDSLLSLLNDVTADMETIRQMEGMLSSSDGETTVKKKVHEDMLSIQQTLKERRERIEQLEKQLASSRYDNSTLKTTIENLKQQIDEQDRLIAGYQEEIAQHKIKIEEQDHEIDSLASTVTEVTDAKNQAEEQNVQLTNEINACYYIVGTNKELKDNGILSKKNIFSRTKVLPGNIDNQLFTKADKRALSEIFCRSKSAEVKTGQPDSSYEFVAEANGDKILVIKDANEFWKKSDYLVIEIK